MFGYPITPQRSETTTSGTFESQWFERTRLEEHPENAPPYNVLLGRLGAGILETNLNPASTPLPPTTPTPGAGPGGYVPGLIVEINVAATPGEVSQWL